MKVPTIFKGKTCKCGNSISDDSVREIGIDFNTEKFLLRFTCVECGFKGRLVFETENKKIEDLCLEIINMTESSGKMEELSDSDSENNGCEKMTMEEVFCSDFDQNSIGCLFIPTWTEESMHEFELCFD